MPQITIVLVSNFGNKSGMNTYSPKTEKCKLQAFQSCWGAFVVLNINCNDLGMKHYCWHSVASVQDLWICLKPTELVGYHVHQHSWNEVGNSGVDTFCIQALYFKQEYFTISSLEHNSSKIESNCIQSRLWHILRILMSRFKK